MRWIRGHIADVAGCWLVLELGLRLFVPGALCATTPERSIVTTCTCGNGDGAMCPMHHASAASRSHVPKHDCSCRGTADPGSGMAAALVDMPAVVTTMSSPVQTSIGGTAPLAAARAPLDAAVVPSSPPPRA